MSLLGYIKAQPTSYIIEFKNGKAKKEGLGLSFFYFIPTTSLVSIPMASTDIPFIIKETTSDFQDVTIQGQITYKISEPNKTAQMLNYTLDAKGKNYVSDDPTKLQARIINSVQVAIKSELQKLPLKEAIKSSDTVVPSILSKLRNLESIRLLGLEILGLSIWAIKPNPETARALEAEIREQLLKEADVATYNRRNAAIEQERAIKENELNTELTVEQKKKQIREAQMDAEIAVKEKENQLEMASINSKISIEKENNNLVSLVSENNKILSDSKSYELASMLKPLTEVDPKILQVLALNQMDSSKIIAQSFKDIAENAQKIGQLNISPDLLRTLLDND